MANTFYTAPTANYVSKTLNGAIDDTQTTITLNNATNLQAPGYVVIDRTTASGTATPDNREVVSYTGISGSDLTGCTRGADGSTARAHSDAAVVETMPTVGMWNSLTTIVATAMTGDGYLKAINSPVSIARVETPFAKASSALMSIVTITGHLNASGASIVGGFGSVATDTIWDAAGDLAYGSAADTGARLAVGTVAQHLISTGTLPAWGTVYKVGSTTKNIADASTTQAVTGVGFKPTQVIFFTVVDGGGALWSVGFDNATNSIGFGGVGGTTSMAHNGSTAAIIRTDGSNSQGGKISSFDADGFTITWTKTGTPTGTAQVMYLAFR